MSGNRKSIAIGSGRNKIAPEKRFGSKDRGASEKKRTTGIANKHYLTEVLLNEPQSCLIRQTLRINPKVIIPSETCGRQGIALADHREPLPGSSNPTDVRSSLLAQRALNRLLGRLQGLCPFKDVKSQICLLTVPFKN
jgi:hypothetical protein